MKIRTFFCENFNENEAIISGDELNHLANVYRHKVGDVVKLLTGGATFLLAEIFSITKKEAKLKILKKEICQANPDFTLEFFVCTLKQDKNEFCVEKLTELGVSNIFFVDSENVSRLGNVNIERLKKAAISATKQCGRSDLIGINANLKFSEMLKKIKEYNSFFVAYENEEIMHFSKIEKIIGRVAVLIGSEGGFTQEEIMALKSAGAKTFSLGARILRAETAVVASAALFAEKMGGLS